MTEYHQFNLCLPNFDQNIRSKTRAMNIVDQAIRNYYTNKFWIWFANELTKTNNKPQNINISDFYASIVGPVDIDKKPSNSNSEKMLNHTPNLLRFKDGHIKPSNYQITH